MNCSLFWSLLPPLALHLSFFFADSADGFPQGRGSFISSINILVPGTLLDAGDRLRTRPTQTLLDTHSPPWQPPAGGPQGLAPLHGVGPLHSSLYLSTSQQHLSLWPSSKVTSIKNFQWLWTLLGLPLVGLWLQSSEPPKLLFILCWGCWSPKTNTRLSQKTNKLIGCNKLLH